MLPTKWDIERKVGASQQADQQVQVSCLEA